MKMKTIRRVVEKTTGVKLKNANRTRESVYARAIYFKLCRERTSKTLEEIGASVNKDHCSVLHAVKNVWPTIMAYNPDFALIYNQIADDEELLPCEERYNNLKIEYLRLLTKKGKRSLYKNEERYIKDLCKW
tara:strand:+ start:1108 stop:1503 length:396 start_codon:yes stop_codon:yes gene_type:complete